jgi:hypothetical protein
MAKFTVTLIHSCSTTVEVDADSVEEAREKAYDSDSSIVTLCYHCSSEVDIGDAYATIVYDEDNNEVGEQK